MQSTLLNRKSVSERLEDPGRTSDSACSRPRVAGKFLWIDDEKFYVKGVTYGPFGPDGKEYPDPQKADQDFTLIRDAGCNCIRTYTVPPIWLLDLAREHGLRVFQGIPWEQHVAFLADSGQRRAVEKRVCQSIRKCSGHPAIAAYVLGNEIPATIVRWHGPRRVERFLEKLTRMARTEDPTALLTYASYPTTEYLELPFLDFSSYNVFLEDRRQLSNYLQRLQNRSGELPLVISEVGLDSLRNGEKAQAESLVWQIQSCFEAGGAGCFVFSWSDEWHRGGEAVRDWAFGLTNSERQPRPAFWHVRKAFQQVPFGQRTWPPASVVVCVYNGVSTIRQCLESVARLSYPDFEVIVIDDGSNDGTTAILESMSRHWPMRVERTPHVGLSAARNRGLELATGEIVAYTDADAFPDSDWLSYLVSDLLRGGYAAIGGPNFAPPDQGLVARCVSVAPGWPRAVLISDREAEHIPGCNMAFRREILQDIGGFDAQFTAAGDDVDICWRLRKAGHLIGYSAAAQVYHQPRQTILGFWRQQKGYGRAETLLERKWPERYDELGQISWKGRIYGSALYRWPFGSKIYHGVWGGSPFQSIYHQFGEAGFLRSWLPAFFSTPEWNMAAVALWILSGLGLLWQPLLWAFPVLVLASLLPITGAILAAREAGRRLPHRSGARLRFPALTSFLFLLQPLARLAGRLGRSIRPLLRGPLVWAWPWARQIDLWNEQWQAPGLILEELEADLIRRHAAVVRGGTFDRWDLEINKGVSGSLRVLMTQEEHSGGRQLVRLRAWPHWSISTRCLVSGFGLLALLAFSDGAVLVSGLLGGFSLVIAGRAFLDSALALGLWVDVFRNDERWIKKP